MESFNPGIQGSRINEDAQLELWIQAAKEEFWEIGRFKLAFLTAWMADTKRKLGARKPPIHVDKEKVRQLQRQGFSHREIGRFLGVSNMTVYRFLNGYSCRVLSCPDCP